MTETAAEMVTCHLSGQEIQASQSFGLTNEQGEQRYVGYQVAFQLASQPVMLQALALSQDTFQQIVQIRQQAEAKTKGVQEGATAAVDALKAKAEEMGLTKNLQELIEATFSQKEESAE